MSPEAPAAPSSDASPVPPHAPSVPPSRAAARGDAPSVTPQGPPVAALTFDVEDWYHCLEPDPGRWHLHEDRAVGATRRVLDLLDEEDTRATFFVLGHVAEAHPELVEEIDARGHEVASHGTWHHFVYRQSPDEFERDVARSLDHLRSLVDQPVVGYRAPYFSITERSRWALPILKRLGVGYDSSIYPVHNHRYGIPDAPRRAHRLDEGLTELPIATYRVAGLNVPCGGGAYLRLLPFALTRSLLGRLAARGERFVFYLHPWELDHEQPRIRLPPALRFRHYHGLEKTAGRLRRLLRDVRFGPVREVFPT